MLLFIALAGSITACTRSFPHGSLVPGSPIGHSGDSRVAKAADGTMRFRASAGDSADQTAVGVSPPSRTAHTHGAAAKADTVVIDTQCDHRHIDTTDGALHAHEPAPLVAAADGSEPTAPARSLGNSIRGASVQDDACPAAKAGHTGTAVQADAIAPEPALLCAAAYGSGRPAPARSSGDLAAAQARGVGGSSGAPTFVPIDIVTDIAKKIEKKIEKKLKKIEKKLKKN